MAQRPRADLGVAAHDADDRSDAAARRRHELGPSAGAGRSRSMPTALAEGGGTSEHADGHRPKGVSV